MPYTTPRFEPESRLDLAWFLRVRPSILIVQLFVFLASDRWKLPVLHLLPFPAVIASQLALNSALNRWVRGRCDPRQAMALRALMIADAICLTALLAWAGPDGRPLSVLFLVNIAVAGCLLRAGEMWMVITASVAGTACVFVRHPQLSSDDLRWQLYEMWMAFAATAALVGYLVQRTGRMLQRRSEALENRQRQAALGTLAAGAAHELATPLSAIAVAAAELVRRLDHSAAHTEALADARLIREQVDRCRQILRELSVDAGEVEGEALAALDLEAMTREAIRDLGLEGRARWTQAVRPPASVAAPRQALAQAVRAVLKNASDASEAGQPIDIGVRTEAETVELEIRDRGAGMPPEVLGRAGEPFFTTKELGRGTGLGLFFVRSLLEQLGGALILESSVRTGTVARLQLPLRAGSPSP